MRWKSDESRTEIDREVEKVAGFQWTRERSLTARASTDILTNREKRGFEILRVAPDMDHKNANAKGNVMKIRLLLRGAAAVMAWLALVPLSAAASSDIGVVVMHGKEGMPVGMQPMATALEGAGHHVVVPELAWSRNRIYDKPVSDALLEIDAAVAQLKAKGAKRIVVLGHSLGGSVALRYAAKRPGLAGVVLSAPAHNPDSETARRLFTKDLERARALIVQGKVTETQSFLDANGGDARGFRTYSVVVTPPVYVSWWGEEDGELLSPRNAAALNPPMPVLFLVAKNDRFARPQGDVYDKAPPHPQSRHLIIDTDHSGMLKDGVGTLLDWLKSLPTAKD